MDSEQLNEKTRIAIDKFFNLTGNTFGEKKKSLNSFIGELQTDYTIEDVKGIILNLDVKTEYDRALKTEIIARFQLEDPSWDVLKSGNGPAIGKLLKNWEFFRNVFDRVTVDEFVDVILPQLSHKTTVKVITVIGKNLNGKKLNRERLADDLFNRLEETYGIKLASIILPNCSIKLIKEKCRRYGLYLSSRSLLEIHKKDAGFLFFYFDLMRDEKRKGVNFNGYVQVLKYVSRTDLALYQKLYDKYLYSIKFGKRLTLKMLPDKESVVKYGMNDKSPLKPKYVLIAARKFGLEKEYLLSLHPSYLDDYLTFYPPVFNELITNFTLIKRRFPLVKELFKMKYGEDLEDHLESLASRYLKYVTPSERQFILDRLTHIQEEWMAFYPTDLSIPMIKEKLKSANDPVTRHTLLGYLYETCRVNNDEKALLEVLKLLYGRYKNDTQALSDFVNCHMRSWKDYDSFTDEHWELIRNLLEYLTYSDVYIDEIYFFERYFVWLVDKSKPFDNLLDEYVRKHVVRRSYYFENSRKHMKIFLEEMNKRKLRPELDFQAFIHFLHLAVQFDKKFPNEIDLLNYQYILDMVESQWPMKRTGYEMYFIKRYNNDGTFNKYIRYFHGDFMISTELLFYCLKNYPEELDNFRSLNKKIYLSERRLRELLLCPYFVSKHLDSFKKQSLKELKEEEANKLMETPLYCLAQDEVFVETINDFLPSTEDGKIEPQTDKDFVTKQQRIIKYIPYVPYPKNTEFIVKFCKGDYLKFALPSLYKIIYKLPETPAFDVLKNLYDSAVSVRKHALFLGRHAFRPTLYYEFIFGLSQTEKNPSIRNILLKKSLECFIENSDEKFFDLFLSNLGKIDKNDKDIYDYLSKYDKIPKEFLSKYIVTIYDSIATNEDKDIREKRFDIIERLPTYVIQELTVDFMKRYLLDVRRLSATSFLNKCLFDTVGEKQFEITNFIFNLIVDNLKSCNPINIESRKNASQLISNVSKRAFDCQNSELLKKIRDVCNTYLPPHRFVTTRLYLDFAISMLKSEMQIGVFVEEIRPHLQEFVKLYSSNMIRTYATTLQSFLRSFLSNCLNFIVKFLRPNEDNEIENLFAIEFLPLMLPSKKNKECLPVLETLRNNENPNVVARLDVYFDKAHD